MKTLDKPKGLITSYRMKCKGIDHINLPVLSDPEGIVVKVYRDGHTEVLCRYLKGNEEDKCDASVEKNKQGFCPYRSFA